MYLDEYNLDTLLYTLSFIVDSEKIKKLVLK